MPIAFCKSLYGTDEKKNFTMEVYPEATHGFFCDERPNYDEASAKDAWKRPKHFSPNI